MPPARGDRPSRAQDDLPTATGRRRIQTAAGADRMPRTPSLCRWPVVPACLLGLAWPAGAQQPPPSSIPPDLNFLARPIESAPPAPSAAAAAAAEPFYQTPLLPPLGFTG